MFKLGIFHDRISFRFFVLSTAAGLSFAAATGQSLAQGGPGPASTGCVEVFPAQPGIQPAILLDRCSGRTWQLVPNYPRRRGASYVWRPLQREDAPAATAAAAPPPRPAAKVAAPALPPVESAKCFTFNGRRYCE